MFGGYLYFGGTLDKLVPHLAETVQLQAAHADGIHDGRVVDDPHGDARLPRPQLEVRVRRRPADLRTALLPAARECFEDHLS